MQVLQPAPPCAAAGVNTGEGSPGSVPEDLRSTGGHRVIICKTPGPLGEDAQTLEFT